MATTMRGAQTMEKGDFVERANADRQQRVAGKTSTGGLAVFVDLPQQLDQGLALLLTQIAVEVHLKVA